MSIRLFIIFLIAVIRFFLFRAQTTGKLQLVLFSSIIQSLMFYPYISLWMVIPEIVKRYDFSSPHENYTSLMYPTVVAAIILCVTGTKQKMKWHIMTFPLLLFTMGFFYSYITPLNVSLYATTIFLVNIIQILFLIYVCVRCIPEKIFIEAFYDGARIIILLELLISVSFVFFGNTFLQSLFNESIANDTSLALREGTNYLFATGTTGQHNRLGALSAFIMVFFFTSFVFKYKKLQSLILFLLSLVVIVLSQSRGAILGSIAAIPFLYLLYLHKSFKLSFVKLISYSIILVLIIILALNLDIISSMFFKSNVETMSDLRQYHYAIGWAMLDMNKFMGCGLNASTHFMYHNMSYGPYDIWLYMHPIHNIHIVIAVELGAIGFILWFYYLFSRLRKLATTSFSKMNNPILWFSFGGMLVVSVVHGMVDPVYIHYQWLTFLLLFGSVYGNKTILKK